MNSTTSSELHKPALQKTLPEALEARFHNPPTAGNGVNPWLFDTALRSHRYLDPQVIADRLSAAVSNCGRRVPSREIIRAVENSLRVHCDGVSAGSGPCITATPSRPPKAVFNQKEWDAVQELHPEGFEYLCSHSHADIPLDDTLAILRRLNPGDPLLCVGSSVKQFATKRLSEWGDSLASQQLIVPNPMSAVEGVTQEGKPSQRSLSNTGARRWLVVEFDRGTFDEQAAVIMYLASHAVVPLVVHSGNKSLHAWIYCHGWDEARVAAFHDIAITLGADPATRPKCHLVRVPGGLRRDSKAWDVRQKACYLNTKVLEEVGV